MILKMEESVLPITFLSISIQIKEIVVISNENKKEILMKIVRFFYIALMSNIKTQFYLNLNLIVNFFELNMIRCLF